MSTPLLCVNRSGVSLQPTCLQQFATQDIKAEAARIAE